MTGKAIDRYSQDYIELQTKQNVKFYKTPGRDPAEADRDLRPGRREEIGGQPLFKEIIESQKKFAERAVKWDLDTYVNRRMAYNRYFASARQARRPRRRRPDSGHRLRKHHPAHPDGVFFGSRPHPGADQERGSRRPVRAQLRGFNGCNDCCSSSTTVSTWVGKVFSWFIVSLTLLISLGGVLALCARARRTRGPSTR
jgi:hypothetical protein